MAWMKKTDGGGYKCFYYDLNSKQRSRSFSKPKYERPYEAAKKFMAAVETDKERGNYTDPNVGKITVQELAEQFMETRTAGEGGLRPASEALYRMHLSRYIIPGLGSRSLKSISKADVTAFETDLRNKGTGAPTVEAVHRLLHSIFSWAVEQELTPRNPAIRTREERKTRKVKTREPRFLDRVEVGRVADEIGPRYKALVWTLAAAGLRIGEATGLRVEDLDLKAGTIRVWRQGTEVNGEKRLDQPPKSERGIRTVDIPPSLSAMLADHLNAFGNRFDTSTLVFTTEHGHPVLQSGFRKMFRPAAARAGISPLPRVHDLRHSAASFMSDAGYTLAEAADQLGHSTVAMTQHYSHIFKDHRQEKVARLDALLGGT